MDVRFRHARRRVAGRIGALVAAVLVIPGLTLAPAHAALGSSLALPLPSTPAVTPQIDGMGSITGTGIDCTNTTTGLITCPDSATLGELGNTLTGVISNPLALTATPAPGWQFDGWSGACTTMATTCTLDATLLTNALTGTPLAPIAEFIPSDGSSEPLPGTCEVGVADCTPPVTALTGKPTVKSSTEPGVGAGVTRETSATFTFKAYEPVEDSDPPRASTTETEGATFECKLAKTSGADTTNPAFTACPGTTKGTATYTGLTDGTYQFSVRAVDADGNEDTTPESFSWTVDTTAPETVLNTKPRFWVLARKAAFGVDVAGSDSARDMSFQCYLDGAGRDCFSAVRFGSGSHVFSAAATDKAGNEDATPVTHTFTMPVNNTALNHSKGWTKAKVKGTFLNTASITKKKGAKVATKATGIKRIALVASKGKGHGVVKVMLGKKTLKKVNLAQKRNVKKRVVPIARFSTAVSGKVTVQVVSSGKRVVIEGLGIATR